MQPDSSSYGSVVCVRDPSLCTEQVCELERNQRWVDYRLSGNSCDDGDHPNTGYCTGDFGAIAEVAGSTAMDGEKLFYNVGVNANGVGLTTDCTGDSDVTAGCLAVPVCAVKRFSTTRTCVPTRSASSRTALAILTQLLGCPAVRTHIPSHHTG